ncbi:unnamed protein product [Pleuronectes platessa]|uniref:Uncharacterized protein n=1 Tax=Pleuronectes platessa TaxID=8262 RepID=A0A9N7W401_PLEPL|nr:unnamed protein product [Pleuronectes platessa]
MDAAIFLEPESKTMSRSYLQLAGRVKVKNLLDPNPLERFSCSSQVAVSPSPRLVPTLPQVVDNVFQVSEQLFKVIHYITAVLPLPSELVSPSYRRIFK